MAKYSAFSPKALLWAALSLGVAIGQKSTTTSGADGLTKTAGHRTESSGTIVIGTMTSTFRVIPTLPASIDSPAPVIANIYDPMAVDAQTVCSGYRAYHMARRPYGFTATLAMAGKACNAYGIDIPMLSLKVQYQSDSRLRVRIRPMGLDSSNSSFYVLPPRYLPEPGVDSDAAMTVPSIDLQYTWTNEPSFGFSVIRKSTGDVLFNTVGHKLVYENQFIEFKTDLPENYNLYGLGESIHPFRLGNNFTKTFWNADVGDNPDANLYGTHPIYIDSRYYEINRHTGATTLVTSTDPDPDANYISYSHGMFMRNAHGQEILLRPDSLTWRALGGSIDLYFLSGPTHNDVIKQYQTGIIGTPVMQQYWTFGYHQCRWGYHNVSELEEVVEGMRKADIPLETIWNDIDWMNQYRDFDPDKLRFPLDKLKSFTDMLAANNQHYVPIIDAAIYIPNPNNISDAYPTYNRGNDSSAFMMNGDGEQYIGDVWPGYTVFLDWRALKAQDFWTYEMLAFSKKVGFSGIWIDMSEASSFCVGSCGTGKVEDNPVHPPFNLPGEPGSVIYEYPDGFERTNHSEYVSASRASVRQQMMNSRTAMPVTTTTPYQVTKPTSVRNLNYPPYVMNNINGALSVHGLAPDALHQDGVRDYDIHNLYGHDILKATHDALISVFPGKRPFVIARSNFAGSGVYSGHWGGDNYARFYYMVASIPQALSMALQGISMFGTDTCGFAFNTDYELCSRWMAMSAFFPFYRNHNVITAIPQEPYRWSSVTDATKKAMAIRYATLPYMYTLMYLAHATGSTVMRALQWEFPNDPTLVAVDRQFMLGPAMLITPVMSTGATTVQGVFPGSGMGTVWYDWYNQTAISANRAENKTIEAPLTHIPVYVRGGYVIPMQEPRYTTYESRNTPWSLLVALSMEGTATGNLYIDDGESVMPEATRFVDFTVAEDSLYASGIGKYADMNALDKVTILGVPMAPSGATLNGMKLMDVMYNSKSKVVTISGLQSMTKMGAWNADWVLSWTF